MDLVPRKSDLLHYMINKSTDQTVHQNLANCFLESLMAKFQNENFPIGYNMRIAKNRLHA